MYEIIYQDIEENSKYDGIIKPVIETCFKEENLEKSKLLITITLTTKEEIRQIIIWIWQMSYRKGEPVCDVITVR